MAVTPLRPSKAPNLLVAPTQYQQQYIDQLNNALRLYFNQIDNFTQNVTVPASGTTANRPTERLEVGQYYFDTSLGYPIYWNGSDWVNALGEPLIFLTGVKTIGRVGTVTVTTV
ncbi:MAG: hypothetical protein ACOYNN_13510 [Terrimicrobiaceae bacterium]|jgi:hypothetical protein